MNQLFEAAKQKVNKYWIEENFGSPGCRWEGDEFYTLNPMRPDRDIGSFSISCRNGKFYDFADGTSGDVFDLLAAMRGVTPVEVVKDLLGTSYISNPSPAPAPRPAPPAPEEQGRAFSPLMDWAPIGPEEAPKFQLAPDYLTRYPDPATGQTMFMVARWNLAGGAKDIYPLFKKEDGEWTKGLPASIKGSGNPRPMMPVDPTKVVVVVEGEKCWHEAVARYPMYSFTTWHGGAQQTPDISGLRGCDVVLWPDHDAPGKECMSKLAHRLQGVATRVRVIDVPDNASKGWDIADAIHEKRDIPVIVETARDFSPEADVKAQGPGRSRPFTDLGNAERFLDMYGHILRFNMDKGLWMIWDGKLWDDRNQGLLSKMYKGVIDDILEVGSKEAFAAANKLQSRSKIDNMLSLASREVGVSIREDDLDKDTVLLNCPNGVVNLRTGELLKHDPKYLMSKTTGIPYNPDAKCPRFLQFLDEIFLERKEIIDMIQRWFGYSSTAEISAQTFMVFHGAGANGKSTLLEVVSRVLGDYSKPAPPDTFIQKQSSGIPNDIAALRGARLVMTTETETNAKLAESKVKTMTGGERMSARYMRAEFFEFMPTWKIVISTNHRPRIQGSDYGIWRRIALVPFDFTATAEKLDPLLPRKLWEEREGILAWIVEGARLWAEGGEGRLGLHIPGQVLVETQNYREEEDLISRFLDQGCIRRGDEKSGYDFSRMKPVKVGDLYRAFIAWAEREGEKYAAQMSNTSFGRALSDRGHKSFKGTAGVRYYDGIYPKGLKEDIEEAMYGSEDDRGA